MMDKQIRVVLRGKVALAALLLGYLHSQSQAAVITDSMEFSVLNSNMWQQGGNSRWNTEKEAVARWGTYAGNSEATMKFGDIAGREDVCLGRKIAGRCIGLDNVDTRTGAEVFAASSGQVGLKVNAEASGGAVDVFLPVTTNVDIGTVSTSNEIFSINTQINIENSANITAEAPSFSASLQGVLDIDMSVGAVACVFAVGCAGDETNFAMHAGEFDLFGIDLNRDKPFDVFGVELPVKVFDTPKNIHAPTPSNPDGIDDEETPQNPADPSPIIGDLTFYTLSDQSGGESNGDSFSLQTNQSLFDAALSIPGLVEAWYESPGILHNVVETNLGPTKVKAEYNVLDLQIGPTVGMQQSFDIDHNATVRLEFDRPITRMVPVIVEKTVFECGQFGEQCENLIRIEKRCNPFFCETVYIVQEYVPKTYSDGTVDMLLGDSADFYFSGDVGQLVNRTYFLDNPLFENITAVTLDPFVELKMGCLKVKLLASIFNECLVEERAQTDGLIAANLYNNSWVMDGFQTHSFASQLIDVPPVYTPPSTVSEPTRLYMLFFAFFLLVSRHRTACINLRGE